MPLKLQGRSLRKFADDLVFRLPETDGKPISVRFLWNLRSYRGDILSGHLGDPIHGASHMRKREVILDKALQTRPLELRRILIHELFHFAWMRLGQPARDSYTRLVADEFARGARGELGWSAQYRKDALRKNLPVEQSRTVWRDYICESFCDTAAWFFSGLRAHSEFTLSLRYRHSRARWFREYFGARKLSI